MTFSKGQIVKVDLGGDTFAFGRVISVDEECRIGQALFKNGELILEATIMPEMVVDAFWQDGTGRYGV